APTAAWAASAGAWRPSDGCSPTSPSPDRPSLTVPVNVFESMCSGQCVLVDRKVMLVRDPCTALGVNKVPLHAGAVNVEGCSRIAVLPVCTTCGGSGVI